MGKRLIPRGWTEGRKTPPERRLQPRLAAPPRQVSDTCDGSRRVVLAEVCPQGPEPRTRISSKCSNSAGFFGFVLESLRFNAVSTTRFPPHAEADLCPIDRVRAYRRAARSTVPGGP